jgi:hypothetical protein
MKSLIWALSLVWFVDGSVSGEELHHLRKARKSVSFDSKPDSVFLIPSRAELTEQEHEDRNTMPWPLYDEDAQIVADGEGFTILGVCIFSAIALYIDYHAGLFLYNYFS